MTHPGWGSEEIYGVQGAGCDQRLDSQIGWHQGEVSSIINLLVSTNLASMFFLWSAVFMWKESTSCKNNLGMCVGPNIYK